MRGCILSSTDPSLDGPFVASPLIHSNKNLFTSYKLNDFLDGPCTCGACIVIPAVVVSNTCSYWPANRDTSVDVPEEKNCIVTH